MTEQSVTSTSWWSHWVSTWPLDYILVASSFFILGLVAQDLYNKDSWIYKNLDALSELFVVRGAGRSEPARDIGVIAVDVQFSREVKHGRLRITSFPRTASPYSIPILICSADDFSAAKHELRRFTIASIPISGPGWNPRAMVWGGDLENGRTIVPQSQNVVEVRLSSGWRRQVFTFRVDIWGQSEQDYGRITLLRKDQDQFLLPNPQP